VLLRELDKLRSMSHRDGHVFLGKIIILNETQDPEEKISTSDGMCHGKN